MIQGLEQQLQKQLVNMQHSIAASGGENSAVAIDSTKGNQNGDSLEGLRNAFLGALGVAALPFTLMSSWTGGGGDTVGSGFLYFCKPRL